MVEANTRIRNRLGAPRFWNSLRAPALAVALFLGGVSVILLLFGVSLQLVALLVAVNFLVALPVVTAIRLISMRATAVEVVFFSVATSQVLIAFVGMFPLSVGARTLIAVAFGFIFVALVLFLRGTPPEPTLQLLTKPSLLPVVVAAVSSLFVWLLTSWRFGVLVPGRVSELNLDVARSDMPFHELMGAGIGSRGIWESGIVVGESLRYHLLSYSWLGSINQLLDAPPFLVQTVIAPIFFAGLLSLGVAAWAIRLSGSAGTAFLAGLLVFVADSVVISTFGGMGGSVIRPFSLSTSFTAPIVLGVAWLMIYGFRKRDAWIFIASLVGVFVAVAGKTSSVVLLFIPLGFVVYALRDRALLLRAFASFALAVAAALAAFVVFAFGQTEGGLLKPIDLGVVTLGFAETGAYAGFVLVSTLAYFARWSGILGGYPDHLRLVAIISVVLLSGTLGMTALIDPTVTNRGWFPVSAAPTLGVFAAVGLVWGLSRFTRYINWWLLLPLSVGVMILWALLADSLWIYQRPGAFPILVAASAIVVATISIRWQLVDRRIRKRAPVLGATVAVPLTSASVLALWLFPIAPSPELPMSERQLVAQEWQSSLQLADQIRGQVESGRVVLSYSAFDMWAPALLGANSYVSGRNYWGLGSSSLGESALARDAERTRWLAEPELPVDSLCSRGISVVWVSNEENVTWEDPNYTDGQIRVWLLDCGVI